MYNITKIGIIVTIIGSAFDMWTTYINLSTGRFIETNGLYAILGSTLFSILYFISTGIIILAMLICERYYTTHRRLTILTILTLYSYGIIHFYFGYQNFLMFFQVMR